MTKEQLKNHLEKGDTLKELFPFSKGDNCEIYKADSLWEGDQNDVVYIADLYQVPLDSSLTDSDPEDIEDTLNRSFTRGDFLDVCGGDSETAEALFTLVEWQGLLTARNQYGRSVRETRCAM